MAPELSENQEAEGQKDNKRIVGWRSGEPLTNKDVQDILRNERRARHEYKAVRKAGNKTVGGKSSGGGANQQGDPLAGLPPTWQAFYSSMPHLDPQAAFKSFRKEQHRQSKEKPAAGATPLQTTTAEDEARMEEEIQKLEEEVKKKRLDFLKDENICNEWDNKLKRLRSLDAEELEVQRRVIRKMEKASYEYGIMEGKLRSSDIYHKFLYDDEKVRHNKQVTALNRSCALMGKQIDMLKADVRALLKAAAEEKITDSEKPKDSDASVSDQVSRALEGSGAGSQKAGASPFATPMLHDQ